MRKVETGLLIGTRSVIMDIFNVFTLLGGLAFFLYGMNVMSGGLEKVSGGKLQKTLKKMTSNPLKSLALGAGITIAIQSSSALTVMLVGLVNSGIMELSSTVGVIMGSNIGTTLTAWILSLAGINSDNVFIKLLKPTSFSPIIAFIGIIMIMMSKKTKKKDIGHIFVGFAVLMFGMTIMSQAVEPLADMPEFNSILTAFKNPFLGVIVGAVFTGIIQSSAASVAILQALSRTGNISFAMALPIIMGQNIGTCVTSLISSIGVTKNAKRVACIHVLFNIIGTAICLIIYWPINIFYSEFMQMATTPLTIAISHTVFNLFTTLLLIPFSKLLVKAAEFIVRDKKGAKESYAFIDERLLNTPSFAISECTNITVKMARLAEESITSAITLCSDFNEKNADAITEMEDRIDIYEDKLGTFLVKLSQKELSDIDSLQVSKLLHSIGDLERIGDHAVNLVNTAIEIHEKDIKFSLEAQKDLEVAHRALLDIIKLTVEAFSKNDISLAKDVEPLEQVIDNLMNEIKSRHINRLQNGSSTIEHGFVLSDMINNFERVSDHCSNIAVTMIEVAQNSYDTHEYLNAIKTMDNEEFKEKFTRFSRQYTLT